MDQQNQLVSSSSSSSSSSSTRFPFPASFPMMMPTMLTSMNENVNQSRLMEMFNGNTGHNNNMQANMMLWIMQQAQMQMFQQQMLLNNMANVFMTVSPRQRPSNQQQSAIATALMTPQHNHNHHHRSSTDHHQSLLDSGYDSSSSSHRPSRTRIVRPRRNFCVVCKGQIHSDGRRSQGPRRHVLQYHVKQPIYKCAYCDYSSIYDKYHVASHAKRIHSIDDPENAVIDNHQLYEEEINFHYQECFPPPTSDTSGDDTANPSFTINRKRSATSSESPIPEKRGNLHGFTVDDFIREDEDEEHGDGDDEEVLPAMKPKRLFSSTEDDQPTMMTDSFTTTPPRLIIDHGYQRTPLRSMENRLDLHKQICRLCRKPFVSRKQHSYEHAQVKLFECGKCQFGHPSSLPAVHRHIKSQHGHENTRKYFVDHRPEYADRLHYIEQSI